MNELLEGLQLLQAKHDYISIRLTKEPDKVQVINDGIFSLSHLNYVLHKDVYLLTVSYDEKHHFQCNMVIPDDYTQEDINKILLHVLEESVRTAIVAKVPSWRKLQQDIHEIFGE